MASPPDLALSLFAPIADSYERWARILSLGQDDRWRRALVEGMGLEIGSTVLDVAAGTGSISRALLHRGIEVVALDQSLEMLAGAALPARVAATAERLPWRDGSFDGVTFGYLLRYVADLEGAMTEIARVVRPGGRIGMLEFGRPSGAWRPLWWLYTRVVLRISGTVIRDGWDEVGAFLGPSIDAFWSRNTPSSLAAIWEKSGIGEVRWRRMSLGGGFVMWGTRR